MENSRLLETLSNCINHCNYCASSCLKEDHVQQMARCIELDHACATVCSTTAEVLMAKLSISIRPLVRYCQDLCEACAAECSQHEADHCQQCAEACRICAEECRKYLA